MKPIDRVRWLTLLAPVLGAVSSVEPSAAQTVPPPPPAYPALPSETPANFAPATDSFDYVKRDVMIPMRDGVKLHTVILVPKGARSAPILYEQEATRKSEAKWWTSHFDDYDLFMQAGSAGHLGRRHGLEQVGFWRKILEHPGYDAFWRDQAVDKVLAAQPLSVPVMLVHSLWDQEDIYGAIAVYKAIEPKDTGHDKVFLVIGPWHHGQEIGDGSALGALKFNRDTALYFRQEILRPFLDQYLKDGAPKANVPSVAAFETGTNTWRRLPAWPAGCSSGCTLRPTPLYLAGDLKLSFAAPKPGGAAFDEYVSDPAKPVPFRARPIQPIGYDRGLTWSQWLVDDQREASGRPDVVAFVSDALTAPVKIAISIRVAHRKPRLPAGAPDHGAGPVELVPALRPKPADLRTQHLLGQARGLSKGRAAHLPHDRPGELRRAASRRYALSASRPEPLEALAGD